MPRFAANLSMLYNELEFLDRFSAARADGFSGVEFTFPYSFAPEAVAGSLRESGLALALFNAYPGDVDNGDFGLAAVPGREREFENSLALSARYADALNAKRIHVLAGRVPRQCDDALIRKTYVNNLKLACARLAEHDLTVLIEPISQPWMPGYALSRVDQAYEVMREVDAPNLRLQLDLYHAQLTEGNLAEKCEKYLDCIGHVQIAGVPGRNEPDKGEINYHFLFDLLDELGYDGWIGCEYRPASSAAGGTSAGLGWLSRYRDSRESST